MGRSLEIVASTNSEILDFGPFVPAIDSLGNVTCQATLASGQSAVLLNGEICRIAQVDSHPDRNDRGTICYYDEAQGLMVGEGENWRSVAPEVGPLGPTMNESGCIAFRGAGKVWLFDGEVVRAIAEPSQKMSEFQGLPVMAEDGSVCFRADLKTGGGGIYRWHQGYLSPVVEGEDLGRFPCVCGQEVGFVQSGKVLRFREGRTEILYDATQDFSSLRGMLLYHDGFVFFATPPDRDLGVYGDGKRIINIGDTFEGSAVTDLALNPVSINEGGDMAIRLKTQDDRQFIVRALR